MAGKWTLHMGCHGGTITSRDSDSSPHDSYNECMEQYSKNKEFYHSIGYYVWFASITDPEGNEKFHDAGVPYRR